MGISRHQGQRLRLPYIPKHYGACACPRRDRAVGFTLLELLIVVAVVGVLISFSLAAARMARSTVRDVTCQTNLKQMYVGWVAALADRNHVIPYTKSTPQDPEVDPTWTHLLDGIFPDAPPLGGDPVESFNVCPTVQTKYQSVWYPSVTWGYAVNTLWQADPLVLNEHKPWDAIRRPEAYPWFMDSAVLPFGNASYTVVRVLPDQRRGPPTWGVGLHHDLERTANVAFANGTVRSVTQGDIEKAQQDGSDLGWFENR